MAACALRRAGVLIVVVAALAGCASQDPRVSLLQTCDAYAAALRSTAAAAARGRLTDEQVRTVNEIRHSLNPICEQPPATNAAAAVVLDSVQQGLETLVFYQHQPGA
jgi:hypothetical protein